MKSHPLIIVMSLSVLASVVFLGAGCELQKQETPAAKQEAASATKAESAEAAEKPAPKTAVRESGEKAEGPEAATTPTPIPLSLADAGELGENIYDAAHAGKWSNAESKLADLHKAAAQLDKDVLNPTSSQKRNIARITAALVELDKSVPAKDKHNTEVQSNLVTMAVASATSPYHPAIPVDVTRLDYLGRELDIWSAAGDTAKLASTTKSINTTWTRLEPKIAAKDAAEAKKFGDIVQKVNAAKTPADYAGLAKPLLDEVDVLEQLMLK